MRKFAGILLLAICWAAAAMFAQQEAWEQQQQREKNRWEERNRREKEAWDKQREAERQHWQDMIERESAAWNAHVEAVKKKWQDLKFSEVRVWVGYGENENSRFQADFENGSLKIEVLGEKGEDPGILQQRAIAMLQQLLRERARPDEPPILEKQLEIDPNAERFPPGYVEVRSQLAPNGRTYQKMDITIPFRQDHLRIRAQRVAPLVQQFAQKYNLNPKLVMAVIHTESSFNPRAISTFRRSGGGVGHAYGLMQLVPFSGGKEAYEFLGGRGEPSPALLFDPRANIELGTVYLHKLEHHYFGMVKEAQSRQYVVTAGYNTGPYNVARAFGGRRNVGAAIPAINALTPPGLFQHLLYNLPYWETRDYLQKVIRRINLY